MHVDADADADADADTDADAGGIAIALLHLSAGALKTCNRHEFSIYKQTKISTRAKHYAPPSSKISSLLPITDEKNFNLKFTKIAQMLKEGCID